MNNPVVIALLAFSCLPVLGLLILGYLHVSAWVSGLVEKKGEGP